MKETFQNNLRELHGQIGEACEKYDRDADDIEIIAVTKTHPASIINLVVSSGIHNVGESRIQEAEPKINEVGRIARFHMIGHLQTNKVKKAVHLFDVIQSVDSLKLAQIINDEALKINRKIDCLIQVNCSDESQKSGIQPDECLNLLKQAREFPAINLLGLMTIGPFVDDEELIRKTYKLCYTFFKQGRDLIGAEFDTLSMGMSSDFEYAIAEGATMIRVGTSLFGPRNY